MKTSKRYLRGTLLTILALPVLIVLYSRIVPVTDSRPAPERTPAAELAALGGFTAIEVEGDFTLEISGASAYSVAYEPLQDERGDFVARVEDSTLYLRGYGNRTRAGDEAVRVRVGVPALQALDVSFTQSLLVSELDTANLALRIVAIRSVTLRDNRIDNLELRGVGIEQLDFAGNRIAASQIRLAGETTITTSD